VLIITPKLEEVEFLAIKLLNEEAESICGGVVDLINSSAALFEMELKATLKALTRHAISL
jgi:hypothetical protein